MIGTLVRRCALFGRLVLGRRRDEPEDIAGGVWIDIAGCSSVKNSLAIEKMSPMASVCEKFKLMNSQMHKDE